MSFCALTDLVNIDDMDRTDTRDLQAFWGVHGVCHVHAQSSTPSPLVFFCFPVFYIPWRARVPPQLPVATYRKPKL